MLKAAYIENIKSGTDSNKRLYICIFIVCISIRLGYIPVSPYGVDESEFRQ